MIGSWTSLATNRLRWDSYFLPSPLLLERPMPFLNLAAAAIPEPHFDIIPACLGQRAAQYFGEHDLIRLSWVTPHLNATPAGLAAVRPAQQADVAVVGAAPRALDLKEKPDGTLAPEGGRGDALSHPLRGVDVCLDVAPVRLVVEDDPL